MKAVKIVDNIYWVGAKDWNVRDFHGYVTQKGTTYNAYLIIDEKVTLIDTVKSDFVGEMLERIKSVIDPSKIDIIVSNHVELDHSGSLPKMLEICPSAEVITSPVGEIGLKKHFNNPGWKFKSVKTGQSINIGKHNLNFVQVPFVHWPDSMVTYCPEAQILFSNDAFGQHLATEYTFLSEVSKSIVYEEAAKYFANIVYLFANQVEKALDVINTLDVNFIAPSHGVLWNENVKNILQTYAKWCKYENNSTALIIYDTMWNSTYKMAQSLVTFFENHNIPVKMRSLKVDHISDIMTDVLGAKYIALGTPVLNGGMMPSMSGFLHYMKNLKPKNKVGFVFGSFGWDNRIYKDIEENLKELGWTMPVVNQSIKWVPNDDELLIFEKKLIDLL